MREGPRPLRDLGMEHVSRIGRRDAQRSIRGIHDSESRIREFASRIRRARRDRAFACFRNQGAVHGCHAGEPNACRCARNSPRVQAKAMYRSKNRITAFTSSNLSRMLRIRILRDGSLSIQPRHYSDNFASGIISEFGQGHLAHRYSNRRGRSGFDRERTADRKRVSEASSGESRYLTARGVPQLRRRSSLHVLRRQRSAKSFKREGAALRLEGLNTRLTDLLRVTKLLTIFERDPQEHIPDPPDPLNPRLQDVRWQLAAGVALTIFVIVGVMLLLR